MKRILFLTVIIALLSTSASGHITFFCNDDGGGYIDCKPDYPVPAEHDRAVRNLLRRVIKSATARNFELPFVAVYQEETQEMWLLRDEDAATERQLDEINR